MSIRFNARTNSIETDAASVDFTQPITTPASTTSLAGFNIAEGVAPSAPVDGDVWVTAAGEFNARLNGSTVDLAAGGGGGVSASGTPVNNQLAIWTDATTIEGDADLTYDSTTGTFTCYGGSTTQTSNFGLSANSQLSVEVGDNYVQLQMTDSSVDTSACNMWFDLDSSSTGSHQFFWSDGGFGTEQVLWVMNENIYRFDGGLELIERADHAGTNISGGRGQVWVKSNSGGGELMYSEGDWDVDYTVQNMMTASYKFDTAVDATDPGSGDVKFNNATAGSVTNIYINDAESTGRDNDFMLGQLADGDLIKLRSPGISAGAPRWWIGTVNGTPTDNTGWWTIPVTHVANSGSVFNSGYPVHIDIDFLSQAGTGGVNNPMTADLDGNGFDLDDMGVLFMREQASANADVTAQGQLWVQDTSPCRLMFTNDIGVDTPIGSIEGDTNDAGSLTLSTTTFAAALNIAPDVNTNYLFMAAFEVEAPAADDVKIQISLPNTVSFIGTLSESETGTISNMYASTTDVVTNTIVVPTSGSTGGGNGTACSIVGSITVGATTSTMSIRAAKNADTGGNGFFRLDGGMVVVPTNN
jgi:hypothetical protein